MKYFVLSTVLTFTTIFQSYCQSSPESMNMASLCQWDDDNLPFRSGNNYNDIWGYADGNGNEVAIMGGTQAVFFIDLSNCTLIDSFNIHNQDNTTINNSLWRDFKTYGQYAYAVADEGSAGLVIFDLSNIPTSVSKVYQSNQFFNKTHNIYIDEANARLYAAGSSSRSNGLIVLDISGANATNPVEIGNVNLSTTGGYVHDVFVKDHIAYASHGTNDGLVVYNFSDAQNPVTMGVYNSYPEQGYNHSSWVNDDNTYLIFCDETFGTSVKRLEISLDLINNVITFGDIKLFKSTLENETNSIAHNPFVKGDNVYLSYYHDGVQVYDISQADTIPKVAYFDTYTANNDYSGFDGAWGVYPFLPSGKIIASDQNNGLFSIEMTQDQALPLSFIEFTISQNKNDVDLGWKVEGFENDAIFQILLSDDGGNIFKSIGNQTYKSNQVTYSTVVEGLTKNSFYHFQIEVVNGDGSKTYSPVRSLWLRGNDSLSLRNNLVTNEITFINGPQNSSGTIQLISMDGKLLEQKEVLWNGAKTTFKIGDYPSQMYMVKVRIGDYQFVEKVFIK